MHSEQSHRDGAAPSDAPGDAPVGRPRMSRRQVVGRMSAVATAGAAAWVVPEILLAKPAAGATLSGTGGSAGVSTGGSVGVSTSAGTTSGDPTTKGTDATGETNGAEGVTTAATTTPANSLAFTGLNIARDAEVGAALIAGGWAMRHWASRGWRTRTPPTRE
jgi:hypothetical protein